MRRRTGGELSARRGYTISINMQRAGFTLVEVMISLVILLIVFMGLIQASLLSINHNVRNEVRDEAVRVGAKSMAMMRSFNYSCGELDPTGTALGQFERRPAAWACWQRYESGSKGSPSWMSLARGTSDVFQYAPWALPPVSW